MTRAVSYGIAAALRSLGLRYVAGFLVNFAGTLVLARALGPAMWGAYTIAYTLQIVAQGLIERGTMGYLIQRRLGPAPTDLLTVIAWQFASGTLAAVALGAAAEPISNAVAAPELQPLLVAVAASVPMYAIRAVPLGLLERNLRYGHVGAVEVADLAVFNAVSVAGILGGAGMSALVAGTLARAAVSATLAWILAAPRVSFGHGSGIRELIAFVAPYASANALSWLNVLAAPAIVGAVAGTRELGVLQIAYMLILYPQILTSIYGRAAFPFYSRMEDVTAIRRSVEVATDRIIRGMGGLTLAMAASAPVWLPVAFGGEWASAIPIMQTVAPALGISMGMVSVLAALNARGHVRTTLAIGAAFTAAYWGLGAWLVPQFGALGLTIGQVLATSVYVAYLEAHRRLIGPLRLRRTLAWFVVMSLLLAAAATAGDGVELISLGITALIVAVSARVVSLRMIGAVISGRPDAPTTIASDERS